MENEKNAQPKEQGKAIKELVKPNKLDSHLIKEVESLCPELATCPTLRRLDGQNVEKDDEILF